MIIERQNGWKYWLQDLGKDVLTCNSVIVCQLNCFNVLVLQLASCTVLTRNSVTGLSVILF